MKNTHKTSRTEPKPGGARRKIAPTAPSRGENGHPPDSISSYSLLLSYPTCSRTAPSVQSTAQALDAQATTQVQSVLVTAQAATATQSALDELNRQSAATATADAQRVTVTAQAILAQATRSALDAQATRAVYELAVAQSQEQARVGRTLLYGAAALALAGTAYVLGHWARALARKTSSVSLAPVPSTEIRLSEVLEASGAQREAQVIDVGTTQPTDPPEPSLAVERMSHIRVIDDPDLVRQAVELFDRLP